MQIDTSSKPGNNSTSNADVERLYYQELAQEFMNNDEIVKKIKAIIGRGSRFSVNIDELRIFNPKLANFVVKNPIEAIKMFEDHLNGQIRTLQEDGNNGKMSGEKQALQQDDVKFPKKILTYHINFEGNFGTNFVTPRGLRANLVNEMVTVQGIVTRMSLVQPKMQTSVHYCEKTGRGAIKNYSDENNLGQVAAGTTGSESNNNIPTKDNNDNPYTTEYGYCIYKDSQTVTIQEMPERAPTGQLPRSIVVVLENDLVDRLKPGDRVEVTGVYRAIPNQGGATNGMFKPVLVATGAKNILHDKEKPIMNEQDIKNIRKIAKEKDVFNIMGNSIASSIEGYLQVKKAILLMLLGGVEKNLENGTHLRGDINLMMVGDPSTAKSQLLRHIMDIAPLAINTTGRGSSGVGLTAAVTMDKDTGEKHLEAGAMVLADKGVVCIDEFDKMNDVDRVAIHEVMEQQTVTIAKAGLHVSLNARCSVIAAANPIYGEYARDQSVAKNIGLPDSLLSRFDLLFVMLDEKDAESDRRIAEKVINNHRYQKPNDQSMSHFNYLNDDVIIEHEHAEPKSKEDSKGTAIYEKYNISTKGSDKGLTPLTREFLKKYISFAKSQKSPELGQDCIEYAAQFYSALRSKANNYDANKIAIPITVRTLETMIRLATSHAKLRLQKAVEPCDIDVAIELLNQCIFQETNNAGKDVDSENEEMQDEGQEEVIKVHTSNSRAQKMVTEKPVSTPTSAKKADKEKPTTSTRKQQRMIIDDESDEFEAEEEDNEEEYKKKGTRASRAESRGRDSSEAAKEKPSTSNAFTPTRNTGRKVAFADSKKSQNGSDQKSQGSSGKKVPKIDHDEQVAHLFQAQIKEEKVFSVVQKRFVFKLVNDLKDKQNKAFVDQLWKQYMVMPENQTISKITKEQMIDTKNHLVEIIEALERDNLVMYAPEDGAVIMI